MPSHSWPVVAVPVTVSTLGLCRAVGPCSVLPQRHARGFVEFLLARRPERVDEHDEEDRHEVDEAPGLGEVGERADRSAVIDPPQRMLALSS